MDLTWKNWILKVNRKVKSLTQNESEKQNNFSLVFNIVTHLHINSLGETILKSLQSHQGRRWHLGLSKTLSQHIWPRDCFQNSNHAGEIWVLEIQRSQIEQGLVCKEVGDSNSKPQIAVSATAVWAVWTGMSSWSKITNPLRSSLRCKLISFFSYFNSDA